MDCDKFLNISFQEPNFEGPNIFARRLEKTDALYVECLHTSTDCYGVYQAFCDADFYANYGKNQPGCVSSFSLQGSKLKSISIVVPTFF
jgi:hypothetical protein